MPWARQRPQAPGSRGVAASLTKGASGHDDGTTRTGLAAASPITCGEARSPRRRRSAVPRAVRGTSESPTISLGRISLNLSPCQTRSHHTRRRQRGHRQNRVTYIGTLAYPPPCLATHPATRRPRRWRPSLRPRGSSLYISSLLAGRKESGHPLHRRGYRHVGAGLAPPTPSLSSLRGGAFGSRRDETGERSAAVGGHPSACGPSLL
jgi:hypothetical protein